ncbi:MAG: peptidoglycan bridge formation glycyltransferase FemA/FemB family protein [Candidatus Kerfeldbacteria bacterium]|nr:peptidoglycan bridge formation glycyltransferase FemA/FemB family protein [Candidatus Kerfeldbacteria bacterium]
MIRPVTDQRELEPLIAQQPLQPYLQSWAWGEFQSSLGRRIWRLGDDEQGKLQGAALVIEHQLMLGRSYFYCPHGPVTNSLESLRRLYGAIFDLAKQEGAMHVKIDPPQYPFSYGVEDFPRPFSPGTTLQPRTTLVIDCQLSETELQAAMHPKTRYNIRLAEKKGVTVRWSTGDADYQTFMQLQRATAARQGIRLHPDTYYQRMFAALRNANMVSLAIAEHDGQALAINEIIWHGQTATYIHGGSTTELKELMAPHLLQWQIILEAKRRGIHRYDLRGIAPEHQPNHKLAGVTRFKRGFGGSVVVFPSAANGVVNQSWYAAYRLAKRLRGGVDE